MSDIQYVFHSLFFSIIAIQTLLCADINALGQYCQLYWRNFDCRYSLVFSSISWIYSCDRPSDYAEVVHSHKIS
jgi:hypothetical protein